MRYNVILDKKAEADILKTPKANAVQIARAIEQRLVVDPVRLGKPLQYELKGFKRLRIGDWRVIYKVEGNTVTVYRIVLRRDAYND